MKKLSLKPNAFNKGEVLTRAQLKKVMGGANFGTGCDRWYNSGDYGKCFNCCLAKLPGDYDYCSNLCGRNG